MRTRRFGPDAVLVDVASPEEAVALAAALRAARESGDLVAADIVPGARSVLVDGLVGALPEVLPDAAVTPGPLVEVPVVWDGTDLDTVARIWGCSPAEVGRRLESIELVAAFCGFAPGFAYLAGLPPAWALPRLDQPRTRVSAGSVAIGGEWCGIYPRSSPGGWRLLGHTETVLWDADRRAPALLAPGTRVRFTA